MTKSLATVSALAVLTATSQGALLVQQWVNFGHNDHPGNSGLAGVDAVIASRAPDFSGTFSVIDFTDDPGGFAGEIPGSTPWPVAALNGASGTGSVWNNDFAARISTTLTITTADTYRFRTYADDGVRLRVGGTDVILDNSYHPEIALNGSIFLTPGNYPLELVFFEGGGEASLEFTMAQGNGPFGHVGGAGNPATSTPDGGATLTLFGLAVTGLAGFRRKFLRR